MRAIDSGSAPPLLRTRRGLMFTALPAIAVLAAVGALLAFEHRQSSIDDRRRDAADLALAAAANARGQLEDRFDVLAAIGASPEVRRRDPEVRRYLIDAARATRFDSLGIVDRRGQAVLSTALPLGAEPVDVSDREYVRTVLRGRPAVSDALISRLTNRPTIAFAFPLSGPNGALRGAITGGLRLDVIGASLERLLFLEGAGATIIDGSGNVIVGETRVRTLRAAPSGFPLEQMRSERSGAIDSAPSGDGERFLGFASLPQTGWLVVVDRPRSEVLGSLDRAFFAEIGALAVLAIVGVLLIFATGRRLDRLDRHRADALAQQREISVTLQESLLPELRVPEGLVAAAGYVPAQGEVDVGGDWYDLVDIGGGCTVFSVGDVVGHGLLAAVAMGKLRSATRSTALQRPAPPQALEHLDRYAGTLDGAPLATMFYGMLDLGSGQLAYASAGHMPPLLLRADGTTAYIEDGRSPLLGAGGPPDGIPRPGGTVEIGRGDLLLLYTDGLVERPSIPIDGALEALAKVVAKLGPNPARLVNDLLKLVPEPRRDDAAVLAVRRA